MELSVINQSGAAAKGVSLSDNVFGADYNEALIHQVVTAYLAGGRAGTRAQKNRSDVSGGGAKPWRQKGTGRARAGTSRSPIWRSGGKAFPASTQDFSQKVNKKMYRGALRSMLSELVRQERLVAIDAIQLSAPKTKELSGILKGLELGNAMIIVSEMDDNLYLASRNIPRVDVNDVAGMNPVDLVGYDKVLITVDALEKIQGWLGE